MQLQLATPSFKNLPLITCTMPKRLAKISWISCVHSGGNFWKFLRKHCSVSWLPIFSTSPGKLRLQSFKWSKGNFSVEDTWSYCPVQSAHTQLKAENDKCCTLANAQHSAGETAVSCVRADNCLKGGYSQAVVTILT